MTIYCYISYQLLLYLFIRHGVQVNWFRAPWVAPYCAMYGRMRAPDWEVVWVCCKWWILGYKTPTQCPSHDQWASWCRSHNVVRIITVNTSLSLPHTAYCSDQSYSGGQYVQSKRQQWQDLLLSWSIFVMFILWNEKSSRLGNRMRLYLLNFE